MQDFDLSEVNTVASERFRRSRVGFTIVGVAAVAAALGMTIAYGVLALRAHEDPVLIGLTMAWGLLVALYGGAVGFVSATRRGPGPSLLKIGETSLTMTFAGGRTHAIEWNGPPAHLELASGLTHVEGIPDFCLVVKPRAVDALLLYRRVLPIIPLTHAAFDAILQSARDRRVPVVIQPGSRYLGVPAPSTDYFLDLPAPDGF